MFVAFLEALLKVSPVILTMVSTVVLWSILTNLGRLVMSLLIGVSILWYLSHL